MRKFEPTTCTRCAATTAFTWRSPTGDPRWIFANICPLYIHNFYPQFTHWGPQVEAEMAQVTSPEVRTREKGKQIIISFPKCQKKLAFVFCSFVLSRLGSTRSKCSWHTRMFSCSSEFITHASCPPRTYLFSTLSITIRLYMVFSSFPPPPSLQLFSTVFTSIRFDQNCLQGWRDH